MVKDKVLFILHLPPPIHGAAKVGEFIRDSQKLNTSFDCDFINLQTSRKLTDTGKGIFSKLYRFASLYLKVFYALLNNRYGLCYMTLNTKGAAFYKEVIVVVLLKLFQNKIVYHFHNKGVSNFQHLSTTHFLYKFVFRNTQSILTSKRLYVDVKKYVSPNNVFICPNGIPPIMDVDVLKRGLKNSNRPHIIFLSNIILDKGVWILLKAYEILLSRNIDFEGHFVGDWGDIKEEEFINQVQEKNLFKHIVIHGKKSGFEKWDLLLNSDIFVLPTLNDCFPLVLLEAMQCSLPIVSTYEGGIPEIVAEGETGYLIPKKDPIELANKLESLVNNFEERLKMGELGKKRFSENFTIESFETNLESIFKTCLKVN